MGLPGMDGQKGEKGDTGEKGMYCMCIVESDKAIEQWPVYTFTCNPKGNSNH